MRFTITAATAAFLMFPMQSLQAASANIQMKQPQTLDLSAAKKKTAKKKPEKVEYLRAVPAK